MDLDAEGDLLGTYDEWILESTKKAGSSLDVEIKVFLETLREELAATDKVAVSDEWKSLPISAETRFDRCSGDAYIYPYSPYGNDCTKRSANRPGVGRNVSVFIYTLPKHLL